MNIFAHCRELAQAKRQAIGRAYQYAEKLTVEELAEQMIEDLKEDMKDGN